MLLCELLDGVCVETGFWPTSDGELPAVAHCTETHDVPAAANPTRDGEGRCGWKHDSSGGSRCSADTTADKVRLCPCLDATPTAEPTPSPTSSPSASPSMSPTAVQEPEQEAVAIADGRAVSVAHGFADQGPDLGPDGFAYGAAVVEPHKLADGES